MKISKLDSHKMRIAIDSGSLTGGHSVRGIGAYTRELVKELGTRVEVVDLSRVDLSGYDVIHYPYFGIFTNTLPFWGLEKAVVTIHDVIPLIYPKHYPPGVILYAFWGYLPKKCTWFIWRQRGNLEKWGAKSRRKSGENINCRRTLCFMLGM